MSDFICKSWVPRLTLLKLMNPIGLTNVCLEGNAFICREFTVLVFFLTPDTAECTGEKFIAFIRFSKKVKDHWLTLCVL